MEKTKIYEYLCSYDKRNPNNIVINEYDPEPRKGCCCDNCFYGRDELALELLKLKKGA